ncbi:hypothetical protein [Pseudoalteromonas luteoviolacea]|uniref:Uncharacterized protein n=1 Tax=Pseudoalteromonas luteoviolacea H33 TaxID=1365251 RepID=A0A167AH76_9GAMM|nr:hypothetical protein [Pseudoalteromonas luteoviolacea]KZN45381.1 hypothetical protein N476_05025 [Pseudoalteromonas luteoviolacea H33]KZN70755.1 hypothetical protein N477_05015 [Pseudoalteromonas luteoviolacea H33-S]
MNKGLLFNYLPELIIISLKCISSESDLLVKLARKLKRDKNISHDHQIFRDIRHGRRRLSIFESYFNIDTDSLKLNFSREPNPQNMGSWYLLKSFVNGGKYNNQEEDIALRYYWSFLEAHCDLEHTILEELSSAKSIELIESYLKTWLSIKTQNNFDLDGNTMYIYLVKSVMYWAALFELFLELEFNTTEYSYLHKVLPIFNEKTNKLSLSTEQFLINFKKAWSRDEHGYANERTIKWADLYRDIAKKRMQDPDITNPPISSNSPELHEPDITAIKKKFDRWRKGKTLISMNEMRSFIAILRVPFSYSRDELRFSHCIFINLFTFIQLQGLELNIDLKLLSDAFSDYKRYKEIVNRRYKTYKQTKKLEP